MITARNIDVRGNGTHSNGSGNHGDGGGPGGLVVVIPAYNEERFIGSVVLQARRCADTVLVVDDGSTDATAEIAESAGAIVARHAHNMGKGAALNTGLRQARELRPAAVVLIDGDGQHLPQEIAHVVEPILAGHADIVVGSRYLDRRSVVPRPRVIGHWLFNLLTNGASGVSLTDSQSGYRAFSPRAIDEISFHSNGFSVESEMQFIAHERHLRMVEVPVTIQYADRPKRSAVAHGLMVLNGVMFFIGQYRPLLFFGLPGLLTLLVGLALGGYVVTMFEQTTRLAVGYAMITVLLSVIGMLSLVTGVMLHSIRGLLLGLEDKLGRRI
jgi:glycosyltransferase involved in cell wall biosynthesis